MSLGRWYPATIAKVDVEAGVVTVNWDDGDTQFREVGVGVGSELTHTTYTTHTVEATQHTIGANLCRFLCLCFPAQRRIETL